jgi:hypothetical protein
VTVHWDHRPTSWTATTATTALSASSKTSPGPGSPGKSPPPLTDPLLDQLIRRWLTRHHRTQDQAA